MGFKPHVLLSLAKTRTPAYKREQNIATLNGKKMGMKISTGHTQISFGNIFSETVGAEWRRINRNLLPELGMTIVQVCGGDVGKGLPALKGQWSGL